MAMTRDEGESRKDVVREGSRMTCPHCGESMEVVGGKLVKGGDRTLYTRAVSAKK